MSDLLPCPFCGKTDSTRNATQEAGVVLASFNSPIGKAAFRVECRCGAHGAPHLEAFTAVLLWNCRPTPHKERKSA